MYCRCLGPYLDANDSTKLGRAIASSATAGSANPEPQSARGAFYLEGVDEHGRAVPVSGILYNGSERSALPEKKWPENFRKLHDPRKKI